MAVDREAACEHDWRINRTWESSRYTPAPDPAFTTAIVTPTSTKVVSDEWYCTRCRLVETRERYV